MNDTRSHVRAATDQPSPLVGWLISRSEGTVYGLAALTFWSYATVTRVLVRALWFRANPVADISSPAFFGLAHLLLAPALVLVHTLAYRVGLPEGHKAGALAKQGALLLCVTFAAKVALVGAATASLWQAAGNDVGRSFIWWLVNPSIAVGSSIDLASQYCLALAFSAGVISWRRYHREALARISVELEAERSRGIALRRQLDPHTLFNTLNAISGAVGPAPGTAIQMMAGLGDLLRLMLRDDMDTSTVAEEVAAAKQLLALYQLRFPDILRVETAAAADCATAHLPPLLLLPLAENAAVHGVESGLSPVTVNLNVFRSALNRVRIELDNTCAPDARFVAPKDSPGIGLRNSWERLVATYGDNFTVEWQRLESTRIRLALTIPDLP